MITSLFQSLPGSPVDFYVLSASDKKNIFVTIKIGILKLLGQIFLAVGRVKEVAVNLS
jgi:hypothetical protein